ncbi:carbonic anhydrase [Dyadobacter fermentans]|uniref:Carbonic anhydrase n=1 Tax=Dyadobacter fermentans (strain ATCC 700827 / DSM 18053 / CIP 107007 / KCTC 52180 / NS114) TaxID=471854 RepID=C6W2A1_DYAFD|nr:carbonic anhydrase [Dyadobacter fermentans]ACT92074.1 hypothetical protein Dfer_0814 [Dyadobacter fermentans DSM 18053]
MNEKTSDSKPFQVAEYRRPHKNVLVISCIDLRLTDNLLEFLEAENLHNRYDLFSIAGTSLCISATQEHKYINNFEEQAQHWRKTLLEHVKIAAQLHLIEDVYIIEHEDCGAYKTYLDTGGNTGKPGEMQCHRSFAENLASEIMKTDYFYASSKKVTEKPSTLNEVKIDQLKLNVHAFFMNVTGKVFHIFSKQSAHIA